MFVDDQGESQSVPIEALAELFRLFNSHVRCVVLNACYSDEQAAAIATQIDCVLGFEGAIQDQAACAFARGFYSALADGTTLAAAREHGLNEIQLHYPDALQPCHLLGRADASNLLPIDWDKPSETTDPAPGESPYKGMEYFDVDDAERFFGREQLTAELIEHLQHQRLLLVIGASGSGKSSLARAGLIATLQGKKAGIDGSPLPKGSQRWRYYLITPTANPLKMLAGSLTQESESVRAQATLMDDLKADPRSLDLYAHRLVQGDNRLILLVDQFEELFTLCKDESEQGAFIDFTQLGTRTKAGS